jgi:hypothetical protein
MTLKKLRRMTGLAAFPAASVIGSERERMAVD